MFRYGGRYLLQRKLTTEGLSAEKDIFTMLTIEETASRNQQAFVVNGNSVAVSLLSKKKDL